MTSASRQKRRLQFVPDLVSGADDEEAPRLQDSKARQSCLAGQYSGHDALDPLANVTAALRWRISPRWSRRLDFLAQMNLVASMLSQSGHTR